MIFEGHRSHAAGIEPKMALKIIADQNRSMTCSRKTVIDFVAVRIAFHNDGAVEYPFAVAPQGCVESGSALRTEFFHTIRGQVEQLVCCQPSAIVVLGGE